MDRVEACRILNLTLDASNSDIRSSFLELSKKYHPDHNQDQVAHDMFILIDKAYRFLMGEEKPHRFIDSNKTGLFGKIFGK